MSYQLMWRQISRLTIHNKKPKNLKALKDPQVITADGKVYLGDAVIIPTEQFIKSSLKRRGKYL